MVLIDKMIIPEESEIKDSFVDEQLAVAFKSLKTRQIESLYVSQKDKELILFFREILMDKYQSDLASDDDKYSNLFSLIHGCYRDLSENSNELFSRRSEAVNNYLKKQSFAQLSEMYKVLAEDRDDYDCLSFIVDSFSDLLFEKVSNEETLDTIKKACTNFNEYCEEQITSKIQEKLNITLN